jgi:hypothetical protein
VSLGFWILSIGIIVIVLVLASLAGAFLSARRRERLRRAEAYNLARRALDDINFNRHELAHPSETTALSLKLETIETLLTSPEFAEVASLQTFQALRAYREFAHALGKSAMVQRTDAGEPLVMSRLLSEEGGREKFERHSLEAEAALQRVFESREEG